MAKKIEEFKEELNEYEEVIGSFQYHGYRVVSNMGIINNDLKQLPRFALLYNYEKGKNYFIFISVKRTSDNKISDISTQMLVIKRKEDVKMVARNNYFDASDKMGNVVHVELDYPEDAITLLRNVMTVKK